jgi:hypothetical protein
MLGSHGERFYQAGVAGLLGADISGAIRPIERPDTFNDMVLGVYGGLYEKLDKMAQAGSAGEYIRAFENFSPTAVESLFKGVRLAHAGLTTTAGQQVLVDGKPFKLNPLEQAVQMLGVKSFNYGNVQLQRRVLQVIQEGAAAQAKPIREQMARAGTSAEMADAERRRREFNASIPLNMKGIVAEIQPYKRPTINRKESMFTDRFGIPMDTSKSW